MSATFVLVHGAWHGGWCWRRVADRLRAGGHTVSTPTPTGLGERSHLWRADIGLKTYIVDVVNLITREALAEGVLCGHWCTRARERFKRPRSQSAGLCEGGPHR